MQDERVGAVGVGDGHHRAVTGSERCHNRGETILTISTVGTVRAIGACCAVGHRESGDGAIRIGDGVSVHQSVGNRTGNVLDATTVSTSRAVSTGRTGRTSRASSTRCAGRTRGTSRTCGTGRTNRASSTRCTVVHHKSGGGAIREVDGISVVQTGSYRAGDGQNATTVLAIRAVLAVLTVQDIEGVRAVGIRDGNLSASGCGSSHYDGREAVRAVLAGRTRRTGWTLSALGTRWTRGALCAILAVTKYIALSCAVRQRQHQHVARIGGRHREGGHIARAAGVQCVRNAQQLLHALDAVVDAAIGVNFRLQIERTIAPRNLAEVLAGVTASHLNREQTVHVCCCRVRLCIDRRTRGTALQNGQTDGNLLFRH